jgi:hypothetical protein
VDRHPHAGADVVGGVNPPASEPESAAAAPSCPALTAVPVPCARPAAVADYTMPTRTEL